MIHAKTRSMELIDNLHSFGMCIAYNRLLTIATELGNRVSNFYHEQNVVCPPHLKSRICTKGAVDNIDHNASSRSPKDSVDGTAISLTQHPIMTVCGKERGLTATYDNTTSAPYIRHLPVTYLEVPPAGLDVRVFSAKSTRITVRRHRLSHCCIR